MKPADLKLKCGVAESELKQVLALYDKPCKVALYCVERRRLGTG
jgi:hypothetical protein